MSNFTLPFSTPNYVVTDPEGQTVPMQVNQELLREEKKLHLLTLQALNTVKLAPRQSTLIAIFDHAQKREV